MYCLIELHAVIYLIPLDTILPGQAIPTGGVQLHSDQSFNPGCTFAGRDKLDTGTDQSLAIINRLNYIQIFSWLVLPPGDPGEVRTKVRDQRQKDINQH